jgi:hypothetical protein
LRLERDKKKQEDDKRRDSGNSLLEPKKEESRQIKKKSTGGKRRRPVVPDVPPPPPRASPTIPQYIQQQIAAETRDSVLAQLKGWTAQDYNAFIEGLVAFADEKDITNRCKLIAMHYLPKFPAEEIKQCFTILSNVAKSKDSDDMEESKPMKDSFPSFGPQPKFDGVPVQYRFPYPFRYPYVPGYPYHPPEFMYGFPPDRRAPAYTPDPFSKIESTSEYYPEAMPPSSSWTHSIDPEYRAREQRDAV